ncbi:MAG: FAD-dependent thymidylate synthase [Nanoarchaeota archaeon]
MQIVNPKIHLRDYSPKIKLQEGRIVNPDEVICAAAGITFKDVRHFSDVLRKIQLGDYGEGDEEEYRKLMKGLVNSAGAGHASLSTGIDLTISAEDSTSKFIDSMFTGARFESALMPSGRRVPIKEDQILVPKSIKSAGNEAVQIYMKNSKENIRAYEKLKERGVHKQQASKIVQYGLTGGGFIKIPLETLVSFSRDFKFNPNAIPQEGKEILSQLEEMVYENGMTITYEARKASPRATCPNPSIFHYRKTSAEELRDENSENLIIVDTYSRDSLDRKNRIYKWLKKFKEVSKSKDLTKKQHEQLLQEAHEIVQDHNQDVRASVFSVSPWRVWGEYKRHRTMPQEAESIYQARKRISPIVQRIIENKKDGLGPNLRELERVFSLPEEIKEDFENLNIWINRIVDSNNTFEKLKEIGIPESDAIYVFPRGLKLGVFRTYDTYNLTTGFESLRRCKDVEPEMKKTTWQEYELLQSSNLPQDIKDFMRVKCQYTGFCHNRSPCKNIYSVASWYSPEEHESFQSEMTQEILRRTKL